MKKWVLAVFSSAVVVCLLALLCLQFISPSTRRATPGEESRLPSPLAERLQKLEESIGGLNALAGTPAPQTGRTNLGGLPDGESEAYEQFVLRLQAVETELKEMRKTLERLVPAAEVVHEDFASPDGYAQADKYLEEGKFAMAASGYLAYLEHHPNHPDAVEFIKKARDAYQKAGYGAKAIDLQKQILEKYPVEDRFHETMTLANLEKEAKRYKEAVSHVEEAAEAATNLEEKLWGLGFRAWYIELDQGPEAGLRAYQEAEQLAVSLGLGDSNPAKSHRQKIERLQKIIAATSERR